MELYVFTNKYLCFVLYRCGARPEMLKVKAKNTKQEYSVWVSITAPGALIYLAM